MLGKTRELVWGARPSNPVEARLLVKIDWFVLSFACLLYWVNYLDRLNLSNAYVSGMKEDLAMHGNELNLINTCFSVGYIVALIPHNLILLRVRPRIWLSFCSLAWGFLTFAMAWVHDYKALCAIRFFQATLEASTFSGCHLLLASWYTETELGKRTAVFTSSGLIGNIFSSTMQAAIYENMDDVAGLAGWRWLFIVDFLITVPISIYGFFCFPDTPETSRAFYFSEEERVLARSRLKKRPKTAFDWSIFKRVVSRWHWWLFSFFWVLGGENESYATNSLFALWLQYFDYSVADRNHFPMGVYAVGVLANFVCCWYIDATNARHHYRAAILIGVVMIVSSILLLVRPLSAGYVFVAHYLSGFSYAGQPVFFSWANVVCYNDLEERAVVLASMNMFSNAVNAWWSLLFYGASTAPYFTNGKWAMIATAVASIVVAVAIRHLQVRDNKREESPEPFSDSYKIN